MLTREIATLTDRSMQAKCSCETISFVRQWIIEQGESRTAFVTASADSVVAFGALPEKVR